MTTIEVIIGLVAVVALVIAFFAHKDHLSFKAEADKDLTTVKTDLSKVISDIEARVRALESKVTPPATPVAPVAASTTAAK